MDPGVAAVALCVPWEMALAQSLFSKGKIPLQRCCLPLGQWQLPGKPLVPPTPPRKMYLLHWEQVFNQG